MFFLSAYCLLLVGFDFAVSCIYVFLNAFFHSSAIMKLQIASCLHICIASYLASHQIMLYNKRIHGHGFKVTSRFFGFRGD